MKVTITGHVSLEGGDRGKLKAASAEEALQTLRINNSPVKVVVEASKVSKLKDGAKALVSKALGPVEGEAEA